MTERSVTRKCLNCLSMALILIVSLCVSRSAQGQATGACCIGSPPTPSICIITTAADCQSQGGNYAGDGTNCFIPDLCMPGWDTPGFMVGACCITDAAGVTTCIVTTQANCSGQGGIYQGDGISCTPDPCSPPTTGACCIQDAAGGFSCIITSAADCLGQGGVYFGDGSICSPADLCDPRGACCISDSGGSPICVLTTASDCLFQGGIYQGDGTFCTPDPCIPPTGACCIQDAAGGYFCIQTTAADCATQLGTYFGDGTLCIQVPCPPPVVGACCYDDPLTGQITCSVMPQLDCNQMGGAYQGDGTTCVPDPCGPATGACCVDDPAGGGMICIIMTALNCLQQGGIYWGDGSSCTPDPCNDPTGACCIPSAAGGWTCVVLTQFDCLNNNGIYQGDNVPCTTTTCPDPKTGACCIPIWGTTNFICIITTGLDCQNQGGWYQGNNSTCVPDPCPPPDPTGACCYRDAAGLWQCVVTTAQDCDLVFGGIYQGDNVPCIPDPCPPDGACCFINAAGLPDCIQTTQTGCDALLGTFYPNTPCSPGLCEPCNDPNAGPCFAVHGTPGCADPACCQIVCTIDPFCCNVTWDANCVATAMILCSEPPCPDPLVFECTAGNQDNFDDTPLFSEPSNPSAALLAAMNACSLGANPFFDVIPDNLCFGHTFTNCWSGCCDMVQSAILEIRLQAGTTITQTDHLQFLEDGVLISSFLISTLPGTGGTWSNGQTATLFLDLGALNPAIIASMQDGDLDVMVDDDTGVDYLRLTVVACPCPNPIAATAINNSNADNFDTNDGPEPAKPSAELQQDLAQCNASIPNYDDIPCNACFGDTFVNLPDCVTAATLTIGLCADGCNAINDTISLELLNPTGLPRYAWTYSLATLNGGPWGFGDCMVLNLDLADLPPDINGVRNILSHLQDGDLDVRVQDDTGVDFMRLDIQYCECLPCIGDITPAGGNGVVNIDDLVALLNAFGPCPPPPALCPADIVPLPNGNGVVNIDDLVALLNAFGPCP